MFWRKGSRIQNFGDAISQYLAEALFFDSPGEADVRLIGSVIDDGFVPERPPFNMPGADPEAVRAIFWGCGIRSIGGLQPSNLAKIELLAVRGPISASELRLGSDIPIGDPALFLPALHAARPSTSFVGKSLCVPHFNDSRTDAALLMLSGCDAVLRPAIGTNTLDILNWVDALVSADFVLSASLHGAIVAAAYQRPFAFWDSGEIDLPLKWRDFAISAGITDTFQKSLADARAWYDRDIKSNIKLPRLWPLLSRAPFQIRPDALMRVLAYELSDIKPSDLRKEVNARVEALVQAGWHFERIATQSQSYYDLKLHEAAHEMAQLRQQAGDEVSGLQQHISSLSEATRNMESALGDHVAALASSRNDLASANEVIATERNRSIALQARVDELLQDSTALESRFSQASEEIARLENIILEHEAERVEAEQKTKGALLLIAENQERTEKWWKNLLRTTSAMRASEREARQYKSMTKTLELQIDRLRQRLSHVAHISRQAPPAEPFWRRLFGTPAKPLPDAESEADIATIEKFLEPFEPHKLLAPAAPDRVNRIARFIANVENQIEDFPIFSCRAYLAMYPDVAAAGTNPLVHYARYGASEGRNIHPLLDVEFYHAAHPEARRLGKDAATHFILWGAAKRFDPHPLFDTLFYLEKYADVKKSGVNPLAHFLKDPTCDPHPLFDSAFYIDRNPEALFDGGDPLSHFIFDGWTSGADPSPYFSTTFYLDAYPDLKAARVNPLIHYLEWGARELRDPHPLFSTKFYLETYPDVAASGMNPLIHFAMFGDREGRDPSPHFSGQTYRQSYPDIVEQGLAPFKHYLEAGGAEGRWPNAHFDGGTYLRDHPELLRTGQNPLVHHVWGGAHPAVLMIDALYPQPDKDSGSMDQIAFIRIFQALGYRVYFGADVEFGAESPYRDALGALGVTVIGFPAYMSLDDFLQREGRSISLLFLSRVHFGARHIDAARVHCPGAPIIFNTVDLHHIRELREAELRGDGKAIEAAAETRRLEIQRAQDADATIVVSDMEKDFLQREAVGARSFMVPLIRDYVAAQRAAFDERAGIAFVGSFDHAPNRDAMRYFLDDIWPLVHPQLPDVLFYVIGSNLPPELSEREDPGVEFVGYVPDLEPWLTKVRLTVAPLRYGAGAKGKVVSSLAHGVPCVTTAIASEGMGLIDGVHIEVATTAQDFAARVVKLYHDQDRWDALSEQGIALIQRRYSIDHGIDLMQDILEIIDAPFKRANGGEKMDPAN
jgi:glycosyltransferase involved in cell wall biosynthesis